MLFIFRLSRPKCVIKIILCKIFTICSQMTYSLIKLLHYMSWYKSCVWILLITTVLKRVLSREQNTWRDDEEENKGSWKLKIVHGILGYGNFFHGKLGSKTYLVGPYQYLSLDISLSDHPHFRYSPSINFSFLYVFSIFWHSTNIFLRCWRL